ncbi:MAG: DUF4139 domain-containing protein [Bacteroidota bacterium]|nr:DUF4139 domain-containing protein [Bacteroidota bacterium]
MDNKLRIHGGIVDLSTINLRSLFSRIDVSSSVPIVSSSDPDSYRDENYRDENSFPRFILFSLMCIFCFNLSAQTEKKVNSTIGFVTVFINQAQVERNAKVSLDEGTYTLIFDKISPNLVTNSIEVKPPNGITLLSVSTQNDFLKQDEKPQVIIEIEDSIERLNEHLADYKADKESIVLQKDLLLANKNIGGTTQGVKADELEDILAIYQKKLVEFKLDWMRLSKQERETNIIVQKLQKQLNEYNQGILNLSNQILVNIKVDRPVSDADMNVSYLVNGVQWQPYYDIRVKDTKSQVQFFLKANLQQSTGENWKNVKLKFTTANPLAGGVKPVLYPYLLRFESPIIPMAAKPNFRGARMDAMNAIPPSMDIEEVKNVSITQNMINTEFNINIPYTIPSDNQFHMVDLTSFQQNAVYSHASVPKIDKDVFVTAAVMANDLINQISGEANVYFEGTFTGKTMISPTSNDTLLLTLGRDKRIVVERVKIQEMSSKSFFSSTKKESNTYEITVKNTTNETVELILEDQIPVTTDKEIEIKCAVYNGGSLNTETGKLEWKLNLQAQQNIKVRFSFDISYPSNRKISAY